jgi:GntR family transcriptional regulator
MSNEMRMDSESPVPLYAQLELILAGEIAAGTLLPGSRLPNEEQLVERYEVSRTTVRQTIQNLVRRGLIEIRRGEGYFRLTS